MQRTEEEINQVTDKIYADLINEMKAGRRTYLEFLLNNCEILNNNKDFNLSSEDRLMISKSKDKFIYEAPEMIPTYLRRLCAYKARGLLSYSTQT
jgi:hypothetical protein